MKPRPHLPNPTITDHRLNGYNYLQWSKSILNFISVKGKEKYLSKSSTRPNIEDKTYENWETDNYQVKSWLLNSMTNEIGKNFHLYETAAEIWEAAEKTYSHVVNTSIFPIECLLHDQRQGELSVTEYFTILNQNWQKLDMLEEHAWKCPEDSAYNKQFMEKKRLYKFLIGLNEDLEEVRGRILAKQPAPSLKEAFAEVRKVESRKKVMLGAPTQIVDSEVTPFSQPSVNNSEQKWETLKCDNYHKYGHLKEKCWEESRNKVMLGAPTQIVNSEATPFVTRTSQPSVNNSLQKRETLKCDNFHKFGHLKEKYWEESRKKVMLAAPTQIVNSEATPFVSRTSQPSVNNSLQKSETLKCDNCHKFGHLKGKCWELHAKLENVESNPNESIGDTAMIRENHEMEVVACATNQKTGCSVVNARRGTNSKGKEHCLVASCPPVGKSIIFKEKFMDGVKTDKQKTLSVPCQKPRKQRRSAIDTLHQDFIERQQAYFAEVDAFELPVEVVTVIDVESDKDLQISKAIINSW